MCIRDRQKMSPGTPMPVYNFNKTEMDDLLQYLFTLPDKAPGA